MAKNCINCETELQENAENCVLDCEKKITAESNVKAEVKPTEPTGKYAVASTSSFFWLTLLFSIPVIGFICSMIFGFTTENLNKKHYARSVMLWNIAAIAAALICAVIGLVICLFLGITVSDIISELGFYLPF